MRCWNCASETGLDATSIGFGATCPDCFAYLHACMGCRHCNAEKGSGCEHPQADEVGDKKHRNLCEFFVVEPRLSEPSEGDREEIEAQATQTKKRKTETLRRFDSLFG